MATGMATEQKPSIILCQLPSCSQMQQAGAVPGIATFQNNCNSSSTQGIAPIYTSTSTRSVLKPKLIAIPLKAFTNMSTMTVPSTQSIGPVFLNGKRGQPVLVLNSNFGNKLAHNRGQQVLMASSPITSTAVQLLKVSPTESQYSEIKGGRLREKNKIGTALKEDDEVTVVKEVKCSPHVSRKNCFPTPKVARIILPDDLLQTQQKLNSVKHHLPLAPSIKVERIKASQPQKQSHGHSFKGESTGKKRQPKICNQKQLQNPPISSELVNMTLKAFANNQGVLFEKVVEKSNCTSNSEGSVQEQHKAFNDFESSKASKLSTKKEDLGLYGSESMKLVGSHGGSKEKSKTLPKRVNSSLLQNSVVAASETINSLKTSSYKTGIILTRVSDDLKMSNDKHLSEDNNRTRKSFPDSVPVSLSDSCNLPRKSVSSSESMIESTFLQTKEQPPKLNNDEKDVVISQKFHKKHVKEGTVGQSNIKIGDASSKAVNGCTDVVDSPRCASIPLVKKSRSKSVQSQDMVKKTRKGNSRQKKERKQLVEKWVDPSLEEYTKLVQEVSPLSRILARKQRLKTINPNILPKGPLDGSDSEEEDYIKPLHQRLDMEHFPSQTGSARRRGVRLEKELNDCEKQAIGRLAAHDLASNLNLVAALRQEPAETVKFLQTRRRENSYHTNWAKFRLYGRKKCQFLSEEDTPACDAVALPCSNLCSNHILQSDTQVLFEPCVGVDGIACGVPSLPGLCEVPLCSDHFSCVGKSLSRRVPRQRWKKRGRSMAESTVHANHRLKKVKLAVSRHKRPSNSDRPIVKDIGREQGLAQKQESHQTDSPLADDEAIAVGSDSLVESLDIDDDDLADAFPAEAFQGIFDVKGSGDHVLGDSLDDMMDYSVPNDFFDIISDPAFADAVLSRDIAALDQHDLNESDYQLWDTEPSTDLSKNFSDNAWTVHSPVPGLSPPNMSSFTSETLF
ncbi:hypothetical protein QYM36_000157 [Artemia franciscana]|uniref:KAT8 regulatory NSL complex subunit 2 n=2 Tax=Artemia franciscana TaxID=6661 RepID=A0AA88LBS6_ARTSF|nr:hypothetical protein QYM36_000157 [Artemia franciscana]KAK2725563.1 hypothetical protein QYM36_000157 [Artemia franciscana]